MAPTLNAFDNNGDSRATVVVTEPQTFAFQPDDAGGTAPGALRAVTAEVVPTLTVTDLVGKTDRGLRIVEPDASLGVRRLTPVECERLQGWPDDHTAYDANGKPIPDSARYRMIGNGVAAPVAKYVAECIEAIL